MSFDEERFQGTTSCRDYQGRHRAQEDELLIMFLEMTTEVDCAEKALLAEETFTTLLSDTRWFNVVDGRLELYTRRGEKLVFDSPAGE